MDSEFQITSFIEVSDYFVQQLVSRKKIALFTDYNHAKKDIAMEFANQHNSTLERALELFTTLESVTDIEEWFNEM